MTSEEAIKMLKSKMDGHTDTSYEWAETVRMAIQALEQEPCEDAISRADARHLIAETNRKALGCISTKAFKILYDGMDVLPPVNPQPKTGHYEKHIDHTDCIWYGNDSGCPVTCSQYRDGWNDAMDYIFKNGKGYQPYRHDA